MELFREAPLRTEASESAAKREHEDGLAARRLEDPFGAATHGPLDYVLGDRQWCEEGPASLAMGSHGRERDPGRLFAPADVPGSPAPRRR